MNLSGVTVGNRYTIEREIGRGGMATVWLAHDAQHARRIAIKTLHPELAGAIGTDRFLREIRITAELQHPSVVPILDSGAVDWRGMQIPWYAMPLLDGESLRSRLDRETQLPIDEALRITTAVGKALAAAHHRGIVHRDIKPENVFLSGDQVYVVDFGVAKAIAATDAERLTSTGLAIGTPTYMSPEQAVAGTVDARSDQYSLAVTLYEMLAGEPPFAGPNQQAIITRRLTEAARPLSAVRSTVPAAVERATLRALERTPADRFSTIEAFLAALQAPSVAGFSVRRWRRPVAALAVFALLVVAALSARAVMQSRRTDPEVIALYQRGVVAYDRRTAAGTIEAASVLNDAVRLDSSYAPAWNALAKTYARAWQRGFRLPDVPTEDLLRRAVTAVERSLLLDESSADAWTTQAIVSHQIDPTDPATALRSVERSLALDSTDAAAWHQFAIIHADIGDLTAALNGWRRSVSLNARYTQGLAFMAWGHYWQGRFDSAAVWADSAIHVDPKYVLAHHTSALVEVERGRLDAAQNRAEAAVRLADDIETVHTRAAVALVKARAGNPNLARAELLAADVVAGTFAPLRAHTAVFLAAVHAALGDVEGVLKALGLYGTPRDMHFQLHLRCDPPFATVADDPRFEALLVIPRPPHGSHC
jgi:tRNA A-37 threonylcarbamoyl transferase component Bud32/Tfp pilus assembly protein PilF